MMWCWRGRLATCLITLATIGHSAHSQQTKPAEPAVATANQAVESRLPFRDIQDFDDAMRGFVATTPDTDNPGRYSFLNHEPPPTVNPSLWRQAQLNALNGLFRVADGVYQVRGFSPANMTIVEGTTGLILIDTLSTPAAAREALDLYFAHRPRKPVVAVIYSHSHADHFGGAAGVVSPADVAGGKTKVIAPAGFMEAVISERATAANARGRRAEYQFGTPLPLGERGNIDEGLGKLDSRGASGGGPIIPPNDTIQQPTETRTIDGVTLIFELALDSEAPSEMLIYLPQSHVLDVAEDATHTLHNLLPFRGTAVRDANRWSQYLNVALERFGADARVIIAQHTWPVWGNERVRARLASQRDLYKYVHDQTIRLMNQGLGPTEIAEALTLPPGLENDWSARGYYGTISHDSKAVYQLYLGWYDGNPATLNTLPRVEEAKKYLEYMGGAAAVIARARNDFKAGHYRWVADVMDQVVFAEPSNQEARSLAADALEQLGYLSESSTWRNAYLLGAQELRSRVRGGARRVPAIDPDMLRAMPIGAVFDYLGTRVNGPQAGTANIVINWRFTDSHESLASTLEHGALTWVTDKIAPDAIAAVTATRASFESVILGQRTFADAIEQHEITTTGDAKAVSHLWRLLLDFETGFPVVEPRVAKAEIRIPCRLKIYALQPPQTMTPMPVIAIAVPARSQPVTGARSTFQSQSKATATYTPPYAAYTRPASVGCSVNNHANSARLTAAGMSNQGEPLFLSHR
jgi:linear primary-alkylsulfatase